MKLGHGYIFFPYVPRSIDVGDRYLADKCPSKKKKEKKERRKVGVSINRSRSWFYFTDIHNRLNKSRKYYLLKIARNNPSTVSYSFSCCATQRFLNGMAVGFVQLIFLSFFFFFFFFNKLNSPCPFENQRNIDVCIRFRGDISSRFPFDRISNFDATSFPFSSHWTHATPFKVTRRLPHPDPTRVNQGPPVRPLG